MAFDGVFTHYLVKELNHELLNGRINKIYQISNYELVFVIRANNKTQKLLLSIHPQFSRMHITESDFLYPQEPPMFCMLLRKHLESGIIQSISQKDNDRIILIDIEHLNEIGDKDKKQLIIEIMGKHSNIILINKETQTIIDCIKHISPFMNSYRTLQPGASYIYPPTSNKKNYFHATMDDFKPFVPQKKLDKELVATFEGISPVLANELLHRAPYHNHLSLYQAYEEIIAELETSLNPSIIDTPNKSVFYLIPLKSVAGDIKSYPSIGMMLDRYYFNKDSHERIKQQTQDLEKFIKNELEKNYNKLNNLNTDLDDAHHAMIYKQYGDLILTHAYQISKGQSTCEVENYYDDNKRIQISLDPLLNPIENSQRYFIKYQKAKSAIHHLAEQLRLTKEEIEYFETLHQQIQSASLADALEIRQELETLRYLKKKSNKQKKQAKPQYATFSVSDAMIYVGKNNIQNDYLTFKLASKDDTWMHVKDMPGSHVIIKGPLNETVIRAGAMLAAYFSKGKTSSSVPVDYTLIKYVKKIPGAKLGFVTYDHQKTIFIDPDEDQIHLFNQKKS
jgi:predicted ribosome quality control (RQC) complex YloA/Tae2 family protein